MCGGLFAKETLPMCVITFMTQFTYDLNHTHTHTHTRHTHTCHTHAHTHTRTHTHTHTPISEPLCFEQDGAAAESGSDEAAERAAEEAGRAADTHTHTHTHTNITANGWGTGDIRMRPTCNGDIYKGHLACVILKV